MATGATIKWNHGWARLVLEQEQAAEALEGFGHKLASEITANIPTKTGSLKEHWGAMTPKITREGGIAALELPIGTSLWHLVEFGSVNNQAYAPIRRGADAAGLAFDSGKGAA